MFNVFVFSSLCKYCIWAILLKGRESGQPRGNLLVCRDLAAAGVRVSISERCEMLSEQLRLGVEKLQHCLKRQAGLEIKQLRES